MHQAIIYRYNRYLDQLKEELLAYENEKMIWAVLEGINNSAGNLATHLIGNLNHYIGQVIGSTGYQRNRPLEFNCIDVPREKLIQDIDDTKVMIEKIVSDLDLEAPYPPEVFKRESSNFFVMCQLTTHLAYHVGQVNYHRRIIQGIEINA